MEMPMTPPSHAAPYLEGVARGVLRYQRCDACGAPQTLARYACRRCGRTSLSWVDSAGSGTVYATTVVTRAPSDEFRALAPYTLVLVDLREGPRVMAHGAAGLAIGDAVEARPLAHAGKHLIIFHPIVTAGAAR
jgi:uncharacterized OB-fold protein